MPSKILCRSNDYIIQTIRERNPSADAQYDLHSLTRKALVREGHAVGVISDDELHSSLMYNNTVVKSYQWTFLDDPVHRQRVRDYF